MSAGANTPVRELIETGRLDCSVKVIVGKGSEAEFSGELLHFWGQSAGWLLGHAVDGLLWGKIIAGGFVLAHNANPAWGASLRVSTLLDLRVFNRDQELRVWRAHDGLRLSIASENSIDRQYACDENQILLAGKRLASQIHAGVKFSLLEGPAGQRQALPLDWDGSGQRFRLLVRHYCTPRPDTGMLEITNSRLVDLCEA